MVKSVKQNPKKSGRFFVAFLLGVSLISFSDETVANAQIQPKILVQEVQPFQTTTRTEHRYFSHRGQIPNTISSNAHGFAGTLHLVQILQIRPGHYRATFSGTVHWIGFH